MNCWHDLTGLLGNILIQILYNSDNQRGKAYCEDPGTITDKYLCVDTRSSDLVVLHWTALFQVFAVCGPFSIGTTFSPEHR